MKPHVWINLLCKWLSIAIVTGLLLIVLIQGAMQFEIVANFLSPVEYWEGEQIPFA